MLRVSKPVIQIVSPGDSPQKGTCGIVMALVWGHADGFKDPTFCHIVFMCATVSHWISCSSTVGSFVTHQSTKAKRRKGGELSPMSVNTTEPAQLRNDRRWTVFLSETSACCLIEPGFHTAILAGFSTPAALTKWEYLSCYIFKVCSDYVKK